MVEARGHLTDVDASQLHGSLDDWEAPAMVVERLKRRRSLACRAATLLSLPHLLRSEDRRLNQKLFFLAEINSRALVLWVCHHEEQR